MGIANCSSLKGAALSLILLAFVPVTSQARGLVFSGAVTPNQVNVLKSDLSNNLSMPDDQSAEKIMGVPNLSDATLKAWLSARIGYVIGQSEKDTSNLVALQKLDYPNDLFPDFEAPKNIPKEPTDPSSGPKMKVFIVMSNVGTSYYYIGKSKGVLVGYKFSNEAGQVVIPITSPRAGILKVGDGLFRLPYRENPNSMVNTWYRLITLFHEAHHSDGNGKSLGFPHAVCPDGSPYFNYNACDREINGAYGVEAYLLKHVREVCMENNSCNAKEAEILAAMVNDAGSRLLAKNFLDSRPEGVVASASIGN